MSEGFRFEWSPWGSGVRLQVFDDKGRHVKSYVRSSEGLCWVAWEQDRESGRV